ncbi:MAG: valine--tRNA ligase, partial [Alphaproteobacteria bacterium]|nr:valine--tRNA ligase [Alphaproteobacteria bacterium]
ITEEIYSKFYKKGKEDRLITGAWPIYSDDYSDEAAKEELGWLQDVIGEIRSLRADMNVPAGAHIAVLVKDANKTTQERISVYSEVMCKMARLEKVTLSDDIPSGAVQTIIGEATVILPIADIIDLTAERARLSKVIDKLDADIKKIDIKLDNEKFVQNAPEEVIEKQRSRKEDALTKREKLASALKQLESAA